MCSPSRSPLPPPSPPAPPRFSQCTRSESFLSLFLNCLIINFSGSSSSCFCIVPEFLVDINMRYGLPRWCSGKEPTCQCRRHRRPGLNPWVGKISWSRKWQPTPGFLHGKSHGQRSLGGYPVHRVAKEMDATERLGTHVCPGGTGNLKRDDNMYKIQSNLTFVVVQLLSHIWLFVTPWTAACQASLSFIHYLLKFAQTMSTESVMPSKHFILCRPLLLLTSIVPIISLFQLVGSSQ